MKYVVITTPTDSRCEVLKSIAEELDLNDQIEFIDLHDSKAIAILDKVEGLVPGVIVDTETWKETSLSKIFDSK